MLSDMSGISMESEYELIHTMKELAAMKEKYVKVKDALDAVNSSGYGVVVPELSQIQLEEPAVIRQGNKRLDHLYWRKRCKRREHLGDEYFREIH